MRKKTDKLVITFHTTADAMAMERFCKTNNVPGRLIPVPRTLSAGCGLAWCMEPDQGDVLRDALNNAGIEHQDIHRILL